MPYEKLSDLPDNVKSLPKQAQEIYRGAFNAAYEEYKDDAKASATAWAAVKTKFEKKGEDWVAKESDMSMDDKRRAIQSALDELLRPIPSVSVDCWIEDIWDDRFVYQSGGKDFECPYSIDDSGKVTLGPSKEVVRTIVYKAVESLQKIYSEIIQEIGKRNASADESRIKKIIALCNELLTSNAEESKVNEAVKECQECLTWLRTQDMVRVEEGVKYPPEAYAYVPDKSKPSEWRLRIWESPDKKVTVAQLGRAAAFLSPGGFKGKKVDISNLSEAKRTIRSEYVKLGTPDDDIPKWVKENTTRELLNDFIPFTEARYQKGICEITVIKAGFNSSKTRYYPMEMLARDYGIFEGTKMYADHPTENDETQRPERSVRDWVATLTNVKYENGVVTGRATIIEPWMQEKLARLKDAGMLNQMGVSINAVGSASDAEIEGAKTKCVEKLIRARSVDFVTEAGAGGAVNIFESIENDIDLIDLVSLRERRPDLVSAIESEVRSEFQKEAKHRMEQDTKIKDLEGQVTILTTENASLKTQLTESQTNEARTKAQGLIKEAVGKSNLPEAAKTRLLERFKDAVNTDGLEEAIKGEEAYISQLAEAGKVKGLGGTKPGDKSHEELVESFIRIGMNKEQAEIAASGR